MHFALHNLKMQLLRFRESLVALSNSLHDEVSVQRAKPLSTLQLALLILFFISDFLSLTIIRDHIPLEMPIVLLAAYMVVQTKYFRSRSIVTLVTLSIITYYALVSSATLISERLFGTLVWTPWINLLASFVSSQAVILFLAAVNSLILLLLPTIRSGLALGMMDFSIAFPFAMAVVIVIKSALRHRI